MSRAALAGCRPFHATPPYAHRHTSRLAPNLSTFSARTRAVCFYEDACLVGLCRGAARLTRAVSRCLAMIRAARLPEQGK